MSVESSKRKFDRILDAISDELGKDHSATRRKARLADISINRGTLAKLWHVRLTSKALLTPTNVKPSTYNPFDKAEFRRRLLTFRSNVSAWSLKPTDITEVKWAARGWELVDKNTVECKRCHKRIVVDLEASDIVSEETEEDSSDRHRESEVNLASHYQALIADGHLEGCLWHERGCDSKSLCIPPSYVNIKEDSIYRVELNGFRNAIERLKARFASLAKIGNSLPNDVQVERDIDIPTLLNSFYRIAIPTNRPAQSHDNQEDVSLEGSDKMSADTAAFILSLLGWARDPTNNNNKDVVIRCDTCFARVGLWMYERQDENGESLSGGGLLPTLFAADSHYYDCPWIMGAKRETFSSSRMDEERPAWKTLATFLNWNETSSRHQEQTEATSVPLTADRTARDASDKARLKRIRELTRSFSFKKTEQVR